MAGWADAFDELSEAHRDGRLQVEDLERLAVAAYMVGNDDACEQAWTAAHNAWLRRGEAERAARCAFWQTLGLFFRGDLAPAMGWVGHGGRLLEDSSHDCVEQAWLRMLTALPLLFDREKAADASFAEAGEIAERFGDTDATMFARLGRGEGALLRANPDVDRVRRALRGPRPRRGPSQRRGACDGLSRPRTPGRQRRRHGLAPETA
jgi:hypothetical protein